MASGGIWAKVHKWLALLMAVQILFWFASGLFFAAVPIERVRSEHMVAEQARAPLDLQAAAAGLGRLARAGPADKVELRTLLGRPVALLSSPGTRPRLYDLASGSAISPIPPVVAARIAEADHAGLARAVRVERVTANNPEYRGALPAWRVDFAEAGRSLYIAADTGAVTARRSTLWRVYDFLWGLHIMDWRGHEDFNTVLLIVATALALVVAIAGIVLLPSRLGFTAWRRRRAAARAAGPPEPARP
jgi:PepSY-associated TM region